MENNIEQVVALHGQEILQLKEDMKECKEDIKELKVNTNEQKVYNERFSGQMNTLLKEMETLNKNVCERMDKFDTKLQKEENKSKVDWISTSTSAIAKIIENAVTVGILYAIVSNIK